MESDFLNVRVETLPNGYALHVKDKNYLYFTKASLIEGFIYHVGFEELSENYLDTIHNIVEVSLTWNKNGDTIKELVKCRRECERLKLTNSHLKEKIAKYLKDESE